MYLSSVLFKYSLIPPHPPQNVKSSECVALIPPSFVTVPVVKATWEKDAGFLEFYSDVLDASIPTISLGVPNTERGELIRSSDTVFLH